MNDQFSFSFSVVPCILTNMVALPLFTVVYMQALEKLNTILPEFRALQIQRTLVQWT